MKEIKIGFIQQQNTAVSEDNMQRLSKSIADLAKQGAQLALFLPGGRREQFRLG